MCFGNLSPIADEIIGSREPGEVGHGLDVPNDYSWLHTKQNMTRGVIAKVARPHPLPHDARQSQTWGSFPECDRPAPRRLQINYLTILYMVTPSPLGQTPCLTGTTNLVVTGTTTAPHASDRVAKKAPLQINPLQTPAPSLAKTK